MKPLIERLAAELCVGLGVTEASPYRRQLEAAARLALLTVVLAWRRIRAGQ